MKALLGIVAAISLVAIAATDSVRPSPPLRETSFAEGGVFVFGMLVLDFRKKIEQFGQRSTLIDCSDETYFCAYGYYLHLVVPRKCGPIGIGKSWQHEGITTEVLAFRTDPGDPGYHYYEPHSVYYLGSRAFPHVVYEYRERRGVTGIIANQEKDIVELASSGRLDPYERGIGFNGLITLDPFAPCGG